MRKLILIITSLLLCLFLCIHLEQTQQYLFFFREQMMTFYNDLDVIIERYSGIGGPSLLLTHWLTQFFMFDYAGSFISGVVGILASVLLWRALPQRSMMLLPLCVLPVIFQYHALYDVYYSYQGLVAYLMFAAFACLYRVIAERTDNDNIRLVVSSILAVALFWLAGAVAFLLSLFLLLTELVDSPRKSWRMLLPVVLVSVLGGFCVNHAYLIRYRYVFGNGAYYEPIIEPSNFFHTSWIIVGLLVLLMPLFVALDKRVRLWHSVGIMAVITIAVAVFTEYSSNRNQQKMYSLIALDHHIIKHDWAGLLATPYCKSSNYLLMNRVNLALSKEGRLLEDLFRYPQIGPRSILTDLDKLSLDTEIIYTLCETYYQMDNIASADEKAFNSYEGLRYGSPSNLQMLVRTSLIFGRYPVAEKYISLLEKTTFYSDWATGQRKYLYNDALVESDAEYGPKRRSLPVGTREFVQARGAYYDLLCTIRANNTSVAARDYAIAYLLLANDVPHIDSFVDEFYGTPVMPDMPVRLQEAVLAAHETDLDYCREHGVSETTIAEYKKLKQLFVQARNNDPVAASSLTKQYAHTYWYYLLVTSPRVAQMREEMDRRDKSGGSVSAH